MCKRTFSSKNLPRQSMITAFFTASCCVSFSLSCPSIQAHLQLFPYSHLLHCSVCFDSAVCSNYESGDKEMTAWAKKGWLASAPIINLRMLLWQRKKKLMHIGLSFDRSIQPAKSNSQTANVTWIRLQIWTTLSMIDNLHSLPNFFLPLLTWRNTKRFPAAAVAALLQHFIRVAFDI